MSNDASDTLEMDTLSVDQSENLSEKGNKVAKTENNPNPGAAQVVAAPAPAKNTAKAPAKKAAESDAAKDMVFEPDLENVTGDVSGPDGMTREQAAKEMEERSAQIVELMNLSDEEIYVKGNEALNAGNLEEAISTLRLLTKKNPDHAAGWGNLGSAMVLARNTEASVGCFKRALRLHPEAPGIWFNLGGALHRLGRLEEAKDAFERAIEQQSSEATMHMGLAGVLRDMGDVDAAIDAYRRAELLGMKSPDIQWNRSLLHLMKGDFKTGFAGLEQRWTLPNAKPRYDLKTQWDGSSLKDKAILVWSDSGFNDMIHFARFVPHVAKAGAKVIFEVPPEAARLFDESEAFKDVKIRPSNVEKPGEPNLHCPLVSLPGLLGVESVTKSLGEPYLQPPKAPRILSDKFKVGIIWNGASRRLPDTGRILPLRHAARLADTPNTSFYSLQRGGSERELSTTGHDMLIANMGGISRDLADVAALMENLDLVIAVDSYQAHIAAAMGKPVWLLLGPSPEWRWHLKPQSSPWYPSVKLYKRTHPLHWDDLIEKVRADLIKESRTASKGAA